MKHGLNLFVGQMIATVGLLVIICIGAVLSFYFTNQSVLENYDELMQEEKEKNSLNQIDLLVSLARQAEKGFYAKQNPENAQQVLNNLNKALQISQNLHTAEELPHPQTDTPAKVDYLNNLQQINSLIQRYHHLFEQSLKLWNIRGFSRDSGLGLRLRQSAYDGLRSKLKRYNTQVLLEQLYRLRWLEHEYYLYGPNYIGKIKSAITNFKVRLQQANLDSGLFSQIETLIGEYQLELERLEASKTSHISHKALENKANELLKLLTEHTINDFAILFRTLVYYEMEYRELGHQLKHVEGVKNTLEKLRKRVAEAKIKEQDKQQLHAALGAYSNSFTQLTKLDREIAQLSEQISMVLSEITPIIQSAMQHEANAMQQIQLHTSEINQRRTTLNILTTIVMLLLVIGLVYWMIRRLGGKVGKIGHNLAQIANGNLQIKTTIPQENKRDELDWITHHINIVADSLSTSMESIKSRNKELEIISGKLAKYLSPQVYRSIFSGQQSVHIQSQRKRLTIFFSDIVGFTHTTDTMESEELTTLLNDYLNEMSKIALEYGGTIDKFIGDAIMIFFGDPETRGEKEDALACVSMAIAMRKRLSDLQQIWEHEKGFTQPFKIRIGIATGYCTVGNFGSEERMDYTIIGGQVNLASRLEHHAQPDQVLISHETYALIKDRISCEAQDSIQVKGIAQAVKTYQVKDFYADTSSKSILNEKGQGYSVNIDNSQLNESERKQLSLKLLKIIKTLNKN